MNDIVGNRKAGCVVDALTLHIIKTFGIENIVTAVCGPIAATQSTIDVFRNRHEWILSQGDRPYKTLFWQNGQVYHDEVTAELIEARRTGMVAVLDWIDQNIEVLPAESDAPISREAAGVRDAISFTFLDPILAAQGANRLFLCEDQSYRQFGVKEFGVRASWLQPVLMLARDMGRASLSDCYEAVYTGAHHDFSVNDIRIFGIDGGNRSAIMEAHTFDRGGIGLFIQGRKSYVRGRK